MGGDDTIRTFLRQARHVLDGMDHSGHVARALRSIESVSLTVLGTGFNIDQFDRSPTRTPWPTW